MKVYVYWNSNDNDCRKIFHFLSAEDEHSIIPFFQRDNEVYVDRHCMSFKDTTQVMQQIRKADIVIFCTHGTKNEILKYQNDPNRPFGEYILIDENNRDVLKDKIVLAFCCSSARVLGGKCVNGAQRCIAYVGFKNDIVYDDGHAQKSRHIIYESYKMAFKKSLEYALGTKCTVEQFRVNLLQNMRKEAMKAIMATENNTLHNMYAGTISGLVALGNIEEKLFA